MSETPSELPPTPPRAGWIKWLTGALIFVGVITFAVNRGELEHFFQLVQQAQPLWLLLGVVTQSLTYLSAAAVWHSVLKRVGYPFPFRVLIPLSIAKLFADQSMPSAGMSGTAFLVSALSRRGIPASVCLRTLVISITAYYSVFLAFALLSLLLLWFYHAIQPWIVALAGLFAVVAPAIPATLLWLSRRADAELPDWLHRLPGSERWTTFLQQYAGMASDKRGLVWTAAWGHVGVFVLDAATLWIVLQAVGTAGSPMVALPALILGSIAATLGPIPLGLGTFEATCVATLVLLGIPIEPALTATLLFRGLTVWLPMLPGLWIARHQLGTPRRAG